MPKTLRPAQMAILALLALVLIVGVIALLPQNTPAAPGQISTMDPTIVFNLTQLPDMPPLTGDEAKQWADFRTEIAACADYSAQKHTQMDRYIDWLINPSLIPPSLAILFGADIRAGLVRAMSADTSTEWRLKKRPAGSCLIQIGRQLNEQLIATGQQALTIYDE